MDELLAELVRERFAPIDRYAPPTEADEAEVRAARRRALCEACDGNYTDDRPNNVIPLRAA